MGSIGKIPGGTDAIKCKGYAEAQLQLHADVWIAYVRHRQQKGRFKAPLWFATVATTQS
jgi:hypothetical protein